MKSASTFRRFPTSSPISASSRRGRIRFRARLENLEDRKVLSTLLDPTAFTSLGTLSTTASDNYTLNTDTQTLTGTGVNVTGVLSNNVAVFDFDSVSIAAGSTITATGSYPVAILSRGTFTVEGTINGNGATPSAGSESAVAGGPGGYGGGQFTTAQGAGLGPGGGGAVSGGVAGTNYGGGGGGFGGAGGQGGDSGGAGGTTYGNLLNQLQGGSGGASGTTPSGTSLATTGGGGGGAMEFVAVTSITVDSGGVIEANGGYGGAAGSGSSGGGSGGGILMKAPTVTNDGTVSVDGGLGPGGGCCGGGGGGGGGILDVLYSQSQTGTGSYLANGGTGGTSGTGTAGQPGSSGIVNIQQVPNITASLSGTEIVFTGDNTVSSLGVTYDPTTETYTFTANSGETFGTDGSLPAGVTFTTSGNTATLAPNGTTWASLGDSVGTDMTSSAGTAITLGGSGAPASNFGTAFDVANSSGGVTSLVVDDSSDSTAGQTATINSATVTIGSAPAIDYSGSGLSSLTLDAGTGGSYAVDVQGVFPASSGASVLTLAMGTGTGNAVTLGDNASSASSMSAVAVTGSTSLTIDETAGGSNEPINVSASSMNFGALSPTISFSNATLGSLTIDTPTVGETAMTVTGSPAGTLGLAPITINVGTASGDTLSLGNSSYAASGLGDVTVTTSGTPPDNGSVALTVDDSADASGQIVNLGASSLTFLGGSTFTYGGANLTGLTFDAGSAGGNTVTMTGSPELIAYTTDIVTGAPSDNPDAIVIGNAANPFSTLAGDVAIQGSGAASLTIDDSGNTAATSYIFNNKFSAGAFPVVFFSSATGLTGMTVKGGSGGDTWDVTGTPASVTTVIETAPASGKADTVSLGGSTAGMASSLAGVTVDGGGAGLTNLVINDVNDTTSRTPLLQDNSVAGLSELTGLSASTLAFNSGVSQVSLMPSSIAGVTTALTVDFSQGNPLPVGSATSFHFAGVLGASNTLTLQGELPSSTPFDSETYTPLTNAPGAGTIAFMQGGNRSTLDFGGLTPINDTVSTTNYSFVAPSSAQVVDLVNGPTIGTATTDTISSGDTPSAFELVNFANKANVRVDLTAIASPTYLSPPSIAATGLVSLTVDYFGPSTTGKTLTVNGTMPGMINEIQIGGSGNTVVVQAVTPGGPLAIVSQPGSPGAANSVVIGDAGSLTGILGDITIEGPAQSVNLTVDGSSATTSFAALLLQHEATGSMAELSGISPGASIAYDPAAISTFALATGTGADHLTVDFVNGNPFTGSGTPTPAGITVQYNAGGGGDSLTFQDSSGSTTPIFSSEDYVSTGPNSGNVSFFNNNSTGTPVFQGGVQFSQLTPTVDSTPVTNYTFTAPMSGGTIAVTDAASPGYALIADPSPSPTFESVAYTNKTNVTIDATPVSHNNFFLLNNATAATGQATLAVNLGSGNDTVVVSANPGIPTTIDGGVGSQAITVNGAGLAAGTTSSNFTILGGTGPDVMRLNSQGTGSAATLTPGTLPGFATATFGTGEGATSLAFASIGTIQDYATNHAPALATPSPLPTLFAQSGVPLVDVPVATFQDSDLIENPAWYVATINWGDGLAPTTGTITANPSTPGQYIISGSHTYQAAGTESITVTLTDLGGTLNSTLANAGGAVVPVMTQLDPIAPVSGMTASVMVADIQLVSTSAVPATAGTPATGELAVFTNPNGPPEPGAYTAMINWGDGSALSGAMITADPSVEGAFDISGTHNYAAPGTYSGTIELHVVATGQSLAIPLSATVQAPSIRVTTGITGKSGVPTGNLTVATVSVPFYHGSPGLDYVGYAASIDYGDGSPTVPATLAPVSLLGASAFTVSTSGHTYAMPGEYDLTVSIRDAAGVVVGTDSATVVINDPPTPTPTPPVLSWGRLSPQSDSGVSNSDGITNVTTPTFVGGATPGAVIQVYAMPTGSTGTPVLIASGVANNAGAWSATVVSSPLAQGSYQVSATATTASGSASLGLGTVVIDTTPPVVTNVVFNRLKGELDVYFQDNLSGMFLPALSNGASYKISAIPLNNKIPVRKSILPTSATVTAGATPSSVDEAVIVFNHGKPLNPGHYTVQVLASGLFDIAGNLLAGRFYGSYPTGNGVPGTNYVAQFSAFPARTLAAFPVQTGYARPRFPTSSRDAARVRVAAVAVSKSYERALVRPAGALSNHAKHDASNIVDEAIASLIGPRPKHRR